jgi:hypothetical protein
MERLALAGLAATLVVHIGSFIPGAPTSMYAIPVLFLLVFTAFAGMIVSTNRYAERFIPTDGERSSRLFWKHQRLAEGHSRLMCYAFKALPGWAQALTTLTVMYVGLNFLVGMAWLGEGGPATNGRRYWLQNHGRYVRELSESEFRQYRAHEVRLFSGHYFAFIMPSVLWYVFVVPRLRQEKSGPIEQSNGGWP